MAKDRTCKNRSPEDPPEWYWKSGLHDARIVGVEAVSFPFEYQKYAAEKYRYERNRLTLVLDASDAMFDSRVKEIHLFNYQILSADLHLQDRKKVWWMADRLTEENGHYKLEIDLYDADARPEEFTFVVRFDRAEVVREA